MLGICLPVEYIVNYFMTLLIWSAVHLANVNWVLCSLLIMLYSVKCSCTLLWVQRLEEVTLPLSFSVKLASHKSRHWKYCGGFAVMPVNKVLDVAFMLAQFQEFVASKIG